MRENIIISERGSKWWIIRIAENNLRVCFKQNTDDLKADVTAVSKRTEGRILYRGRLKGCVPKKTFLKTCNLKALKIWRRKPCESFWDWWTPESWAVQIYYFLCLQKILTTSQNPYRSALGWKHNALRSFCNIGTRRIVKVGGIIKKELLLEDIRIPIQSSAACRKTSLSPERRCWLGNHPPTIFSCERITKSRCCTERVVPYTQLFDYDILCFFSSFFLPLSMTRANS